MRYAGFWIRVLAAVFDCLICLPANIVFACVVASVMDVPIPQTYGPNAAGTPAHAVEFLSFLFGLCYYVASLGSVWQATPGKLAMGICVVRADGSRISHLRALVRYFGSVLSGLLLGGGFIMVAFTRKKTALHDRICDTRVVYRVRSV